MARVLRLAAMLAVVLAALTPGAVRAAGETASVAPNTGLRNEQKVRVQGRGFRPRTVLVIILCNRGATSSADCEGQSADVSAQTDASGAYDHEYEVLTWPTPRFLSSSITCDATQQCDLFLGEDFNDFTQPKALVPISFANGVTASAPGVAAPTSATTAPATPGATVPAAAPSAAPSAPPAPGAGAGAPNTGSPSTGGASSPPGGGASNGTVTAASASGGISDASAAVNLEPLAGTGLPRNAIWLLALGAAAFVVGTAGRRIVERP